MYLLPRGEVKTRQSWGSAFRGRAGRRVRVGGMGGGLKGRGGGSQINIEHSISFMKSFPQDAGLKGGKMDVEA